MHLSPETLNELSRLIQRWSGLALGPDKGYLIRHRLGPVVRNCGFHGFDELLLRLRDDNAGAHIRAAVVEAITTKETSFFRDAWLFDALARHALPEIATASKRADRAGRRVRIWSAGTSTGQEAYSLAMIVREYLDSGQRPSDQSDVSILASDISAEAIDVAKAGLYSTQEVQRGLSESRVRRFFRPHGDGWQVNDPLRRLVQFRTFNLLSSMAEVGTFDLILCRNVLIYFDEATRARVGRTLCAALKEGGWLALGSAESLYGAGDRFDLVKFGRAFVYRRKRVDAASTVGEP
jgi:chemotaxis protein methyltransferase CheR